MGAKRRVLLWTTLLSQRQLEIERKRNSHALHHTVGWQTNKSEGKQRSLGVCAFVCVGGGGSLTEGNCGLSCPLPRETNARTFPGCSRTLRAIPNALSVRQRRVKENNQPLSATVAPRPGCASSHHGGRGQGSQGPLTGCRLCGNMAFAAAAAALRFSSPLVSKLSMPSN